MNKAVVYIGVDVAKASLDVAWAERSRRFANNKSGLSALTKWVKQSPFAVHLICEASGGYERGLLDAAEQNRIKVSLVHANRVRQYARAAGILAKTDKVDARVLCALEGEGLIAEDQTLKQKAQKLTAIAGVGTRTAVLLLARMPELGTLNRTQAAALAGLAPFNRDSGTSRGKRTIFGGRRALRCGLYMAALVAARHNLILRNFYQRLRSNGKPHKVALTAVMRKLLLALNHTLKPTTCFA